MAQIWASRQRPALRLEALLPIVHCPIRTAPAIAHSAGTARVGEAITDEDDIAMRHHPSGRAYLDCLAKAFAEV